MEKQNKNLENIQIKKGFLVGNFKGNGCQLLWFKSRKGYFKYKAQQTFKKITKTFKKFS